MVFIECTGKADITFVLDSSRSIKAANPADRSWDNYELMKQFVIQLIRRLSVARDNVRVASVSYSNEARLNFPLNRYYTVPDLVRAIEKIEYLDNQTHTADALHVMRTQAFDPSHRGARGDRPDVPNIGILITDGASNVEGHRTIPSANRAKDDGIRLLVIGVTNRINERELKGISSTGVLNQTYWKSLDFRALDAIISNIINQTCKFVIPGEFS